MIGAWRQVEPGFWWCPDAGTAVRTPDGWYASSSGYRGVFVEPIVGPFKTHRDAIEAYEKKRLEIHERRRV